MKIYPMRVLFVVFVLLLPQCVLAMGFGSTPGTIPNWDASDWSYDGDTGPAHWADLSPSYKECGAGLHQSPVDINQTSRAFLPPLQFNYHTSMVSINRKPNQLWLEYDSGSSLKIGAKRYKFIGFDFHTPGEHSFRGRTSDMEIHLHHISASGEPLVVAIPVNGGHRKNITLTRIGENIPALKSHRRNRRVGINAMFLLPADRSYYTYQGSETRPPCTEGVQWVVLKSPIRVSWDEIDLFKSFVGPNARVPQPLNNRVILSST
jgi:carbonic anhydrase